MLNTKNKLLLSMGSAILVVAPVATVISCSSSSSDPGKIETTPISGKTNLEATSFGLENYSIDEIKAKNIINAKWVFENKNKLLDGTVEKIDSESAITSLSYQAKQDDKTILELTFDVAAGKSYDENGKLTTKATSIKISISKFPEKGKEEAMFDDAIQKTNLVSPQKVTLTSGKSIALANATINKENQISAIQAFLKTKWSNVEVKKGSGDLYSVSLSANTNAAFNKIFGKDWKEIFETNQENEDMKNVKQVIYGFKILEKEPNTTKDGIAKFTIEPSYIQFSFNQKPSWLNDASYRYSLSNKASSLRFELQVKNTESGTAGTEVE